MRIFVINAGQELAESKGELNKIMASWTKSYFEAKGYEVKVTHVSEGYIIKEEVDKFVWADLVFYHTPIWWFSVPFDFKRYIDEVFTEGIGNGMLKNDGRRSANPKMNYGRGGLLDGRKYMLTTTWNAPLEAFTIPGELFEQTDVDKGVMFGFHIMNTFVSMESLPSFHLYDVMKDPQMAEYEKSYKEHLDKHFS